MAKKKTAQTTKKDSKKTAAAVVGDAEEAVSGKHLDTVLKEVTAGTEKLDLDEWIQVQCPYCGEVFDVHATSEEAGQSMIEDCGVCCRPISLHIKVEDEELTVSAFRA